MTALLGGGAVFAEAMGASGGSYKVQGLPEGLAFNPEGFPTQMSTPAAGPRRDLDGLCPVERASGRLGTFRKAMASTDPLPDYLSVPEARESRWKGCWKRDIVYLGGKEVAEIDSTGTHTTLTDHLGSPRILVNPDGTVIQQKFAPFGESLTNPTDAKAFSKGFTGHENTDQSGLIYMQARFYLPMYHRFGNPDPGLDQHFQETQSWNIYSYVQNNPTMKFDPDGMAGFWASLGSAFVSAPVNMYREMKQAVQHPIQTAKAMSKASPGSQLKSVLSMHPGMGGVIKGVEAAIAGAKGDLGKAGTIIGDHMGREATGAAVGLATEGALKGLGALRGGGGALAPVAEGAGEAATGTKVFRAWGDGAGPNGRSWTPVDPSTVPDFRSAAGLPGSNTARFISEGTLVDNTGVKVRNALPLDGNPGGLKEFVVPEPAKQIKLERVSGNN